MRFNGITDALKLQIGQRVKIPDTADSSSVPASGIIDYQVVRGDTLYSIARRHEIALQALRAFNSLDDNYVLKEGDTLRIPQQRTETAGTAGAERPADGPAPGVTGNTLTVTDPRSTVARTVDASVRWPVAAKEVVYMNGKLNGVVLLGERAESVKSLTQGTVVSAGPYRGFGKVAIVQVSGGYLYVYGGCESLSVKEGDQVVPGTELGKLGVDALSEKPQLFFLVYRSNTPVDPAKAPRA